MQPAVAQGLVATGVSVVLGEVTLLAPVDVAAAPGTCTILRGPNGAGKTTLLRLLTGRLAPTTGTVTLDGRPIDERDDAVRTRMAALLGIPTTYRDLTLIDHLTLIDATWGRDRDTTEERTTGGLAALGIEHLADRFPHELSSGQTQLFRLAMTLFRPSDILVLDEPEQRLDTQRRAEVAELIAARRDAGDTVVLACHDPAMTERLADRVVDLEPAPEDDA